MEPAHPPININNKNMIIAKAPQLSNCALTYPVPVKIETTLKIIDLRFICVELLIVKYISLMRI